MPKVNPSNAHIEHNTNPNSTEHAVSQQLTMTTQSGCIGIAHLEIDFTGFSLAYMQSRRAALMRALTDIVVLTRAAAHPIERYQPMEKPIMWFAGESRDDMPASFGVMIDTLAVSDEELVLRTDDIMGMLTRQYVSCEYSNAMRARRVGGAQ